MTSRRDFLETSGLAALGLSLPVTRRLGKPPQTHIDIHRAPDAVFAEIPSGLKQLAKTPVNRWTAESVTVTTEPLRDAVRIALSAPATPVRRLHLRWRGAIAGNLLILGDAWERGYGDLEWRGWAPDRVMPWYVATHDGARTHCYGVETGPAALCFWQLDPQGISLWADVRSGSAPVELGQRELELCRVVSRPGRAGETAFAASTPSAAGCARRLGSRRTRSTAATTGTGPTGTTAPRRSWPMPGAWSSSRPREPTGRSR